ncbi:MAG TPA: hypothetical protein GX506_06075 [Firmicutes bacterium]|nr:hypothetical protein [Bacillota bacterium]
MKDGAIILTPAPESLTGAFCGALKGVYGLNDEEADEYLRQERDSW